MRTNNSIRTKFIKLMKDMAITSLAGFTLFMSSCAPTGSTSSATTRDITIRNNEQFRTTVIMHWPQVANLDINKQKITFTKNYTGCELEECKVMAYYDALQKHNIDGIVEPSYKIEIERKESILGEKRTVTSSGKNVTITGFPYVYKNIREMTKEDKEFLIGDSIWVPMQTAMLPMTATTTERTIIEAEKKPTNWLLVGAVSLGALLLLAIGSK